MKVICDNCRAVYKIPDEKLAKPVNKATCRKCGHRMLIPRPRQGANPDEKTLVTAVPPTPPPAPMRGLESRDRSTTPMLDEEPENTMPGLAPNAPGRRVAGPGDDVPLYAATPMPTPDRVDHSKPVGVGPRAMVPPPPAPDLSFGGGTPPNPGRRNAAASLDPRGSQETTLARPQFQERPEPRQEQRSHASRETPSPVPRQSREHAETPVPQSSRALPTPVVSALAAAPSAHAPEQPTAKPRPTPMPAPRNPVTNPNISRNPSTNPSIATSAHVPHDPGNDLLFAMIGVGGAMIGAFILLVAIAAISPAVSGPMLVVIFVGTLLAFTSGLATLMVILTGARGRRPSRPLVSLGVAGVLGLAVATFAVLAFAFMPHLTGRAVAMATPTVPAVAGTAPATDSVIAATRPPTPAEATAAEVPADVPPAEVPVVATPAEVPAVATVAPVSTSTPPKTTGSTTKIPKTSEGVSGPVAQTFAPRDLSTRRDPPPTSTSRPAVPEEDELLIDEPPAPKSDLPATVSYDVIDLILRNNNDIKRCFFNWKKTTGDLPAKVTVNFQILPSGAVKGAHVVDEDYVGTELDSCLNRSFTAISFPETSGSGQKLNFPFQLQ